MICNKSAIGGRTKLAHLAARLVSTFHQRAVDDLNPASEGFLRNCARKSGRLRRRRPCKTSRFTNCAASADRGAARMMGYDIPGGVQDGVQYVYQVQGPGTSQDIGDEVLYHARLVRYSGKGH